MHSIRVADSLSSTLVTEITKYRNNSGSMRKVSAEVGYFVVSAIAYKETGIAMVATAISLLALPVSSKPTKKCLTWLSSSAFTMAWSFTNLFINPYVDHMIAREQTARQFLVYA